MAELRIGRGLRDLPNSSGSRANRSQAVADIALFGPLPHDIQLRLVATRSYAGGLVQREYG